MDLILWRHAEAVLERPDHDDLDRALTTKGERQAQRMAEWLNQRLAASTRILVSPARRCQQTARALDRHFKTVPALAPDADGEAMLKAARWPDGNEPVLLIGHQPTLGLVASYVLTGVPAPWAIKKGAVWWLRNRDREGGAQVVLQAVMGPEFL
jgi:phosphohistidine phosphatase